MARETAFAMIPHKDKRHFGGEDAFAIDKMGQYLLLVVADGIGGWKSKYGYSAGKFTHALVSEINNFFLSGIQDPETLVREAIQNVNIPGACTMIIVVINKFNNVAYTYQVGDADYLLLNGDGKIKSRGTPKYSAPKQPTYGALGLNAPYRIARKHMTLEIDIDKAVMSRLHIEKDDTLILGSDGLWDNLFIQEIVSTASFAPDLTAESIRDILIDKVTRRLYNDPPAEPGYNPWNKMSTPYSKERQAIDPDYPDSPKIDDTTFIVYQMS
jgi:protein phosphatase PTC7